MRPTWHLVAAEDIRRMLSLTAKRLKKTFDAYAKVGGLVITPRQYDQNKSLLVSMLEGNKSLTRQEIEAGFIQAGINQPGNDADKYRVKHTIALPEVEGILCSGVDKGKKTTYALLDERVSPTPELHKEEALARLARRYFRSHSPANLNDQEHRPKAFSNNGTFYPVILHKGKIVGNWNKSVKKGQLTLETSFFDPTLRINPKEIERAENRYKNFYNSDHR